MDKEKVIGELEKLIQESKRILEEEIYFHSDYREYYINDDVYECFRLKINTFFRRVLKDKEDENIKKIKSLNYGSIQDMNIITNILINTREYVEKEYIELDSTKKREYENSNTDILDIIFSNFHKMARKIRDRYDNRETLDIKVKMIYRSMSGKMS